MTAGKANSESRNAAGFLAQLGKRAPFDTGWMPPGLRSFAQAGNHTQLVIECPPAINRINWGEYEGDEEYKTYLLAQPWRIIFADLLNGDFYGARMFYSPIPFNSPEQPLYHANVPNLNCKGYNGNGVGWLCLYHKESWKNLSITDKVARTMERCSGVETFNNRNMRETDGPRFYAARGKPNFTYEPEVWENKSEEEGVEWTLDPDLWIPVLVQDENNQDRHYDGGVPLTVAMAMNGKYNAYYGDKTHPKPVTALRKGEIPAKMFESTINDSFNNINIKAFTATPTAVPAPVATPIEDLYECHDCNTGGLTAEEIYHTGWGGGEVLCEGCNDSYCSCEHCGQLVEWLSELKSQNGVDNICEGCTGNFPYCDWCETYVLDEDYVDIGDQGYHKWCAEELEPFTCDVCNLDGKVVDKVNVALPSGQVAEICKKCEKKSTLCADCVKLVPTDTLITLKNLEMVCGMCVEICNSCHYPVRKIGGCPDCTDFPEAETTIAAEA